MPTLAAIACAWPLTMIDRWLWMWNVSTGAAHGTPCTAAPVPPLEVEPSLQNVEVTPTCWLPSRLTAGAMVGTPGAGAGVGAGAGAGSSPPPPPQAVVATRNSADSHGK